MKKIAIIIAPNYRDYAKKYLIDCIDSVRRLDLKLDYKIFMIDNQSSDESYDYLKLTVPEAMIFRNDNNEGFAKGNNDPIRVALKEGFDYIVLFNMDTIVDMNCVKEMISVIEGDERIGAVQARLMLWPERQKINSLGNTTHFLGFGYSLGYQDVYRESKEESSDIFYPSGAGVLFRAETLKNVGLFDEEMWMYNEDQDLGWRIWLAGMRCVIANKAVVYHKYEFGRSIKKYYWMDRNRIIAILKNYNILTLILILPAFIIMEIGLIVFSIKSGWFREKMRVWKYFLTPKKWVYIFRERNKIQKSRLVKDKQIIKMISGKIWYQEIDDIKLRLVNPVFNLYWKIVKFLVIW